MDGYRDVLKGRSAVRRTRLPGAGSGDPSLGLFGGHPKRRGEEAKAARLVEPSGLCLYVSRARAPASAG